MAAICVFYVMYCTLLHLKSLYRDQWRDCILMMKERRRFNVIIFPRQPSFLQHLHDVLPLTFCPFDICSHSPYYHNLPFLWVSLLHVTFAIDILELHLY